MSGIKNKFLLFLAFLIAGSVVFVRIQYSNNYKEFEKEIQTYEAYLIKEFEEKKVEFIDSLKTANPIVFKRFESEFSSDSAKIKKDTIYKFAYLKEIISYSYPSKDYLPCLASKCEIDRLKESTLVKIKSRNDYLQRVFKEEYSICYQMINKDSLIPLTKPLIDCSVFFSNYSLPLYDDARWKDFESFLRFYKEKAKIGKQNIKYSQDKYQRSYNSLKRRLNTNAQDFLDKKLAAEKSFIIVNTNESSTFKSKFFGSLVFSYSSSEFKEDQFKRIEEAAIAEHWKNNSLRNGSMPYSACYGNSNYCSGYNCSQISIKNGGRDVVVTVKNLYDQVIRHAYIKARNSFTFKIPNGTYNIYFYSGEGWNPNIVKKQSPCLVKGGFVSNESYGKDNNVSVYNHILSYELVMTTGGNFSMAAANPNEVF